MKKRHLITRRRLRPPLLFLHLPKAAGTSVFTLLQDVLRPRYVGYYLDRTQFGEFNDFGSMSSSVRAGLLLRQQPAPNALDLAAGHVARTTLLSLVGGGGGKLMTVVREPKSRLLSHWLYWRGYDNRRLKLYGGWGQRIALSREGLTDFTMRPEIACATDNPLLRMLLWPNALIPDGDFIDARHDDMLLSEALGHLARFDFVGSVENPHLMAALGTWLDSAYPPFVHVRTMRWLCEWLHGRQGGGSRNEQILADGISERWLTEEITNADRTVQERTRLDHKLWNYVQEVQASLACPVSADAVFSNTIARYTDMAHKGVD